MSDMGAYPNGSYNQQPGGYGPNGGPYNQQPAGYGPAGYGPGGYGPAGYGPGGYGPRPDEKNSLGGWALGLGIAGLFCCSIFTGIPAIILGVLGMQAANEGRATNKGMSITGIVMGALSIVFLIIYYATGMHERFLESWQVS
jgi:flagelliform silk protein (fragment)